MIRLLGQIKGPLMQLIGSLDRKPFLQRTLCTLLATLVTDCNGLQIWPSLINDLLAVPREHPESIVPVFGAIERICEDAAFELLDHPETFKGLLETVLGALPQVDQPLKLRCGLFSIVTHLIPTQASLLTENIDYLLESTFTTTTTTANSKEEDLQICACRLLSTLNEFFWTLLTAAQVNKIFSFIFSLSRSSSHEVIKECAEFWLSVVQGDAAFEQFQQVPQSFLAEFIPLLIDRCAYDDLEDEEELCKALEDLNVPDEVEEDLPRGIKRKTSDETSGEVVDDEEEDDDDDEVVTSLRKCSAATLDGLSLCVSASTLLPIFLPAFNARVASTDWKQREAALLAFGAVSEALWPKMSSEHLEQVAEFLLANAKSHPHPLVRSMSLWSLSRIATWMTSSSSSGGLNEALRVMIGSLVDANKRVQQSAASALCKFIESSDLKLFGPEHLKSLISAIFLALQCYQRRSLLVLYELIRTLTQNESSSACLLVTDSEGLQYWRSIAGWLVDRFGPASVDDFTIFPLVEALMAVLSLQTDQGPERLLLDASQLDRVTFFAVSLAHVQLQMQNHDDDDLLIAALDLLAAAVESTQMPPSAQLYPLIESVLMQSIAYRGSSFVRQSAFALIGDYAALASFSATGPLSCFNNDFFTTYYAAVKDNLLPTSMESVRPAHDDGIIVSMATATNAVWSLGELVVNCALTVPQSLLQDLMVVLREKSSAQPLHRLYLENLTVCVGRLLNNLPSNPTITNLPDIHRVIRLLSTVESDSERCSALAGYLRHYDPATLNKQDYCTIMTRIADLIDFSRLITAAGLEDQLRGRWLKNPPCQFSDLPPLFHHFLQNQ